MGGTPILDREQPAPVRRTPIGRSIAIGLVLGIALEWAVTHGITFKNHTALELWLTFVVCLYLVVLVHELGHAMAGFVLGFELRGLAVGPFFLQRLSRGWGLRFSPWLVFSGGLATIAPRSTEDLRRKFIWFGLGGPIATALFIAVCVLAGGGFWWTMLLAVNLLAAGGSYVPYIAAGGQPTDAMVVWILARGGASAEWLVAMLHLLSLDARGILPRDWPAEWIEKVRVPPSRVHRLSYLALQCEFAADSGPERFGEALEEVLAEADKMRPTMRRAYFVAAACFQGFARGDAARAEAWFGDARKVKGAVSQKDWDSKARAAILCAQGRVSDAQRFFENYLALLDRQPLSGMMAAERERTVVLMEQVNRSGLVT